MNGYRKYMIAYGGNLGWCKPYVSKDGNTFIINSENNVDMYRVDTDTWVQGGDLDLNTVGRELNPEWFDEDRGYDALYMILEVMEERSCRDCPYFKYCEAMDNPDSWEDNPLSEDYPDDEGD